MTEQQITAGDLAGLDEQTLIDYVTSRRWFGSKTQEVIHAHVVDSAVVRTQEPLLTCALLEVRFAPGTHELYQLLVGWRRDAEGWEDEVIARAGGWTAYDALADPVLSRELVHVMRGETTIQAAEGTLEFRPVDLFAFGPDLSEPRSVGVEQSNSSVVFGDELILKAYRRLEAGINPELELVRFLTERGFPHIAALAGWYAYSGAPVDATLGLLQEFIPGARDGWELALEAIAAEPAAFVERLGRLGEVTGALHTTLASDASDPEFAPEEPSSEALALLTATVDEEIESIFLDLPEDTEALAPIAGRGEEVRDLLRMMTHAGSVGRVIRTHGDYHLGQVLWTGEDWIVLDFEGEPARSLPERRRKASPLRDVAGMLRSFAYAASAAELEGGTVAEGLEDRAREAFLAGYFDSVDRSLVPPGQEARERLLAVFELEKAVYELRYELDNRPDWIRIPVAGIVRILEGAAA